MENSFAKKIFFFYLPAFIWMGAIFYLSSIPELKSGAGSISLEIFLRKGAHIFEFMILAFLFWRIAYRGEGFSLKHSQIFAFILVFLYAVSDEIHQMFIEGRAGKTVDVIVDTLSGLLAVLLIGLKYSLRNAKKRILIILFSGTALALIIVFMMMTAGRA